MEYSSDLSAILSQLGFAGLVKHNCFNENDEGDDGASGGPKDYEMKVARLCVQLVSFCSRLLFLS